MNKKKFFGFIAIVVLAVIATVNVNLASQERGVSDLAYANTEALADDEDSGGGGSSGGGGGGESSSGSEYVSMGFNMSNYSHCTSCIYGPWIVYDCFGSGDADCPN